ncbi:tetratricopeptide repeat protein 25-like [Oncorhynchus kisutch]|uniref:tetratricopeptide repeat protein 25-like n=1 Tax=Oncorhynchus kisutch TaxID=8019 RepID=UPI0012DF8969|nr:tetratricopeptide repeat protein 25-like [Oncorhynchus kisutch]
MGNFEFALVFYHRGHKRWPELQEFRLGIQKAQEAIDNSVGYPSSVNLENKGDLSFFHKADEGKKGRPKGLIHPLRREMRHQNKKMPKSEKTAKQLLGELYSDKEKLLKDEGRAARNLLLSLFLYVHSFVLVSVHNQYTVTLGKMLFYHVPYLENWPLRVL